MNLEPILLSHFTGISFVMAFESVSVAACCPLILWRCFHSKFVREAEVLTDGRDGRDDGTVSSSVFVFPFFKKMQINERAKSFFLKYAVGFLALWGLFSLLQCS